GAVPRDLDRLVGPQALALGGPAQHARLQPHAVIGGDHHVAADLDVVRPAVEVALLADDRPRPLTLVDVRGELAELSEPGLVVHEGLVGLEAPAYALRLLLQVHLLDLEVRRAGRRARQGLHRDGPA